MHALLLSAAGHLLRDVRHIDNLQRLFGSVVCKIDTRHNTLACNNHIPHYKLLPASLPLLQQSRVRLATIRNENEFGYLFKLLYEKKSRKIPNHILYAELKVLLKHFGYFFQIILVRISKDGSHLWAVLKNPFRNKPAYYCNYYCSRNLERCQATFKLCSKFFRNKPSYL